jgi:hypothetical protein
MGEMADDAEREAINQMADEDALIVGSYGKLQIEDIRAMLDSIELISACRRAMEASQAEVNALVARAEAAERELAEVRADAQRQISEAKVKSEELRAALEHIVELTGAQSGGPWTRDIQRIARAALATPAEGDMCASCICELSCIIPMKHHMRVCDAREATPAAGPYSGNPATCECDYHRACRGEGIQPAEGTTREEKE